MEETKRERRPLQFSMRKLMLWTVVWAVCLSSLHVVVLFLSALRVPHPRPIAIGFVVYLAILLPIRIFWGSERGARIAIAGTFVALACPAEAFITSACFKSGSLAALAAWQFVLVPLFLLGLVPTAFGYLFVHLLVVVVDWLDGRMQAKRAGPGGRDCEVD